MAAPAHNIVELLASTPAEKLARRHQFVTTVKKDERLRTAFEQLIINDIYSAPVFDEQKQAYVGMLDLVDLVALVAKLFREYEPFKLKQPLQKTDLQHIESQFYNTTVGEVLNASGRNPYNPMLPTVSLLEVTEALTHSHRIPIIRTDGTPSNVLSQARILQFIAKHLDSFGNLKDKTVKELHLGYRPVLSVESHARAIEAFEKMAQSSFSSAAIVDAHGHLHGNISIKDLKGILADFSRLLLSVDEYINIIRRQSLKDIFPSIECSESYTIAKLIQKFDATGVHRLYLIGENAGHLLGVISLEDLLKFILAYYKK